MCCWFEFWLCDVCSLGLACEEPYFMGLRGLGRVPHYWYSSCALLWNWDNRMAYNMRYVTSLFPLNQKVTVIVHCQLHYHYQMTINDQRQLKNMLHTHSVQVLIPFFDMCSVFNYSFHDPPWAKHAKHHTSLIKMYAPMQWFIPYQTQRLTSWTLIFSLNYPSSSLQLQKTWFHTAHQRLIWCIF